MIIQHNISAINSNRLFNQNHRNLSKDLEKLSSGYRINRSADDAAGLAISEKMRAQIGGLTQAEKNCHDAVSLIQTAEGALEEVHTMLHRMNSLALQSANGIYDDSIDRASLQLEFEQLQDEIDFIAEHTDFNGMKLFDGTGGTTLRKLAGETAPAQAGAVTLDASKGSIIITDTGYSVNGGAETAFTGEYIIKGTASNTITVKGGTHNITLDSVSYSGDNTGILIQNNADVTLTLSGSSSINSAKNAGITIESGSSLTIEGNGAVDVKGGTFNTTMRYAGINAGSGAALTINSGTVTALGGYNAAGIGGNNNQDGGNITINGGTVTANGQFAAAGIGGGYNGSGGNIEITGGSVTANGGMGGAGIGGGQNGSGGNVIVTGGQVTAKGGTSSDAGIGHGTSGTGGSFTTTSDSWAVINVSNGNSTSGLNILISDTSDIANWNGTINGTVYGNPKSPPQSNVPSPSGDSSDSKKKDPDLENFWIMQSGARTKDTFTMDIGRMNTTILGVDKKTVNIRTAKSANTAVDIIHTAINKLSTQRATLGACQNRLEHKIDNMNVTNENTTAAESRIRDADMAKYMMKFTKDQVLTQAAQSMLAHSNSTTEGILSLLM